nr:hypothetical protein [Acinetobacter nosocomialis]
MFLDKGPFCIYYIHDEYGFPKPIARCDQIEEVEVIRDLTTKKATTKGYEFSETTTSTSDLITRTLLGGALKGTTGEIIGGVTAAKKTQTVQVSQSTEEIDKHLLQLKVKFLDGNTLIINTDNPEVMELLFSYVGVQPVDESELQKLRKLSLQQRDKEKLRDFKFVNDQESYEQANQIATEKLAQFKHASKQSLLSRSLFISFLVSFIVAFLLKSFVGLLVSFIAFLILGLVISKVIYIKLNFHNESKKARYHALFEEEVFKQITSIRDKK